MKNRQTVLILSAVVILVLIASGCTSTRTITDVEQTNGIMPRADISMLQPVNYPQKKLQIIENSSRADQARVLETAPEKIDNRPKRSAAIATSQPPQTNPKPAERIATTLDSTKAPEKPREAPYSWEDSEKTEGPIYLVVSLSDQKLHVYRNGVRIAQSKISTGRDGYETPTGVFPILQKKKSHVSNLYPGAKMPYMQRLTWDGIALHGGHLPGRPASHGCIRLPYKFAKQLYAITNFDTTVIVKESHTDGDQYGYL